MINTAAIFNTTATSSVICQVNNLCLVPEANAVTPPHSRNRRRIVPTRPEAATLDPAPVTCPVADAVGLGAGAVRAAVPAELFEPVAAALAAFATAARAAAALGLSI